MAMYHVTRNVISSYPHQNVYRNTFSLMWRSLKASPCTCIQQSLNRSLRKIMLTITTVQGTTIFMQVFIHSSPKFKRQRNISNSFSLSVQLPTVLYELGAGKKKKKYNSRKRRSPIRIVVPKNQSEKRKTRRNGGEERQEKGSNVDYQNRRQPLCLYHELIEWKQRAGGRWNRLRSFDRLCSPRPGRSFVEMCRRSTFSVSLWQSFVFSFFRLALLEFLCRRGRDPFLRSSRGGHLSETRICQPCNVQGIRAVKR